MPNKPRMTLYALSFHCDHHERVSTHEYYLNSRYVTEYYLVCQTHEKQTASRARCPQEQRSPGGERASSATELPNVQGINVSYKVEACRMLKSGETQGELTNDENDEDDYGIGHEKYILFGRVKANAASHIS